MSNLLINSEYRQLIPRWHTSRKMGVLSPSALSNPIITTGGSFDFRIERKKYLWEEERSISSATELFLGLKMSGKTSDPTYDVVRDYLLSKPGDTTDTLKDFLEPRLKTLDLASSYETDEYKIYHIISKLKKLVRNYPDDSLTWNDLSFYYAVIGEKTKSVSCMSIAYHLSHKHVLLARSYSRLLVHHDEPDKALRVLRDTGNVKVRPELLSADISIRDSFDIGSPDVSTARRLIDRYSSSPHMISELSASLGTIEVKNGAIKKGKGHFTTSYISPTENTVAQLKWLHQQHKIIIPEGEGERVSVEAEAISHYNQGNYSACRNELMSLHNFQPFSNGPLADSGYLSLIALDDPGYVVKFSEYYRPSLKENVTAKNNYIVAKIETGSLSGIEDLLFDLISSSGVGVEKPTIVATVGLYLYEVGDIDQAREKYSESKGEFKLLKNNYGLSLCLLFQAMAEKKLGLEPAEGLFIEAQKEAEKLTTHPEVLEKIKRERSKKQPTV